MVQQHDDPVLHLYGSPIPVVEDSKFLGILFDRKLSFIPHIKYLKTKCLKALNLLKVLYLLQIFTFSIPIMLTLYRLTLMTQAPNKQTYT